MWKKVRIYVHNTRHSTTTGTWNDLGRISTKHDGHSNVTDPLTVRPFTYKYEDARCSDVCAKPVYYSAQSRDARLDAMRTGCELFVCARVYEI